MVGGCTVNELKDLVSILQNNNEAAEKRSDAAKKAANVCTVLCFGKTELPQLYQIMAKMALVHSAPDTDSEIRVNVAFAINNLFVSEFSRDNMDYTQFVSILAGMLPGNDTPSAIRIVQDAHATCKIYDLLRLQGRGTVSSEKMAEALETERIGRQKTPIEDIKKPFLAQKDRLGPFVIYRKGRVLL